MRQQICKYCEEPFKPGVNHRGLINVCLDSSCQQAMVNDGVTEPVKLTACVSWENKHTPTIEIVSNPMVAAAFNGAQKRVGATVAAGMNRSVRVTPAERHAGAEPLERPEHKHGFDKGDLWLSGLREKHAKK